MAEPQVTLASPVLFRGTALLSEGKEHGWGPREEAVDSPGERLLEQTWNWLMKWPLVFASLGRSRSG